MRRKLFVLVLLMVSAVSFAQNVSYDEFMRVVKSKSYSDVTRFLSSNGWKTGESWTDGSITGDPWKVVTYYKNCSVTSDGDPRNTTSGWGILQSYKSIKTGKTKCLIYKFGNYNVYTQYMSAAKANGYKYDSKYSYGEIVCLSRNRYSMSFEKEGNYYSIMYSYIDYE